jgi:hypothetical protein
MPKKAKSMFSKLYKEAKQLRGFFGTKLTLPDQTMADATSAPSMTNNDENNHKNEIIDIDFHALRVKKQPKFPPHYPIEAGERDLMTVLALEMKIGKDGKPKTCRPLPGPWLAFFAPDGIEYAMEWEFEPARVDNDPVESQFILNVVFLK